MAWEILQGDVLDVLRGMTAASVDFCMTSPPYYGLRSYLPAGHPNKGKEIGSEATVEEYTAKLVAVFREVRGVLVPWGMLALNLGDSLAGDNLHTGRRDNGRPEKGNGWADYRIDIETRARTGSGIKTKDLCNVPHRVAEALRQDGWYWRSTVVWQKCLSGGTWVYARTQKGEMPMTIKDLVRLKPETVQLWNGQKWTQCLQFRQSDVDASGIRHKYRREWYGAWHKDESPPAPALLEIEFRSGERVGCTAEHRWPTREGVKEASQLKVGDIVQTCHLPEPENPHAPAWLPDEDAGWLVGLFIAEGNITDKGASFSLHQEETAIVDRLRRIGLALDCPTTCRATSKGKGCVAAIFGPAIIGILHHYVGGTTSHDKHFLPRVWKRSNRFLQAVLDGYLEGDGHWREKVQDWRIGFTQNDQLAADLRCLAARLGLILRLRRVVHKCQTGNFPGWRGRLRKPSNYWNAMDNGEIIAIRASRARKFWDISVADEPHLFALASGLLTHNSAPMPESVSGWRWERCRVKAQMPAARAGAYAAGSGNARIRPGSGGVIGKMPLEYQTQWAACPGCAKCEKTDGLILRKGSWRPTRSHEFVFLLAASKTYFADGEPVRTALADASVSRYGYAFGGEKNETLVEMDADGMGVRTRVVEDRDLPAGANMRDVLTLGPSPLKKKHYAAYPPELVRPLIEMGTSARGVCPACRMPWVRIIQEKSNQKAPGWRGAGRENGCMVGGGHFGRSGDWSNETTTLGWRPSCRCAPRDPAPARVLDPFLGSGTTALVSLRLGRDAVGIELFEDYVEMARRRIVSDSPLFNGVDNVTPELFT